MDLKFKKRLIDKVAFEACSVFDVNDDGISDIICGENWYEGPDYIKKHKICDLGTADEYFHDFSDYGMDVDGDGLIDIVTGSWWTGSIDWLRNPGGGAGPWEKTLVDKCGAVETVRFIDIDGCGTPEVIPNTPGNPQAIYKLIKDADGKGAGSFEKFIIYEKTGHGMGFGDITGNGRIDLIYGNGWLEQPDDIWTGTWIFHPEFNFEGAASVPIIGHDITGNGLTDIIIGNAHGYGLFWYEQMLASDSSRSWVRHDIDLAGAEYHDMILYDIDGDGQIELVTGKRYRSHLGNDPGDNDNVFIYYFKINGGEFEKHIIDYGPASEHSGVGIYFWIADMNGDGRPDIIAPGKEGLYLFENLGY